MLCVLLGYQRQDIGKNLINSIEIKIRNFYACNQKITINPVKTIIDFTRFHRGKCLQHRYY